MEISLLTADDIPDVVEVWNRSFGILPAERQEPFRASRLRMIDAGRALVVRDAGRVVAAAHYTAFRQWWRGNPVDMAGVGSVIVSPEYRSRGVGSRLLRELLALMCERGFPLSALYPATVPPYRRVGYELAGRQRHVRLPTTALRPLARAVDSPPEIRRAGVDDAAHITSLLDELYRSGQESGPFTWPTTELTAHITHRDDFHYVAEDGFLAYGWSGDDTLKVHRCVAGSADTARALWAQVGSGASIAPTVEACVAPDDPLFWLLPDVGSEPFHDHWWMLRLLDAPAAIAARGFPSTVEADVPIDITDGEVPANSGHWQLTVSDGAGSLVPRAPGGEALRMSSRGMAALYSGVAVTTLRGSDLATGGTRAADDALSAAFAATPMALDSF